MRHPRQIFLKIRNTPALVGVLFVLLLILSASIFFLSRQQRGTLPEAQLAFHPDAVTSLQWTLGKKTWSFLRDNRNQSWQPTIDPYRIQRKLILLATLPLKKMKPPTTVTWQVHIEFGSDKNSWEGAYDSGRFVWTTGRFAGQGAQLLETQDEIFLEGRFAFDPLKWSWCEARPHEIHFAYQNDKWALRLEKNRWFLTVNPASARPVDGAIIERWLGSNCQVSLRAFRDLKMDSLSRSLGNLNVIFENGHKAQWPLRVGWIVLDDDRAGFSNEFLQQLTAIKDTL